MLDWRTISFVVPAMSFDVLTKNALSRQVPKVGPDGRVMTVDKIVPKARPRFGRTRGGRVVTFNKDSTTDFEAWIRRHFFMAYPSSGGVYRNGEGWPVHEQFLGCQWYGEDRPCTRFKYGKNFLDCQACAYRRKNLALRLEVHLKDERKLDLDNVIKIVLDALNQVFFYDDSQFVHKEVMLVPYSAEGEQLKIRVKVVPPQFQVGSVIGVYAIKNMNVETAKTYLKNLLRDFSTDGLYANPVLVSDFVAYVRRCDKRKYVETLEQYLTAKDS